MQTDDMEDETNLIENSRDVRTREVKSEGVKQNLNPADADCLIPNGGNEDEETTSTRDSVFPEENKKRSRRIGRFRFARSLSSPAMILRGGKERVPARKAMDKEGIKEEVERLENVEDTLQVRPKHVSFDESVHVLTMFSVVKMPLRRISARIASGSQGPAGEDWTNCGRGQRRAGCLKNRVEFSQITTKKVAFSGDEMLKAAILEHDFPEVERLCQQCDARVNKKLSNGLTLLHISSIEGCFRILQYILNQGGSADAMDDRGWTPLHYAALHGNVPCALALLSAGANIDSMTRDYQTAIELAGDDGMILLLGMIMNGALGDEKVSQNKETYV